MDPIRIPQDLDRLRELCRSQYGRRPVLLRSLMAVIDEVEAEFGEQGTPRHSAELMDRVLGPAFTAALEAAVGAASPEEEAVARVLAEWHRIGPTLDRP
jgi:hypothetical protein